MNQQTELQVGLADIGYRPEQMEALAKGAQASEAVRSHAGVVFTLPASHLVRASKQLARMRRHGSRKMKVAVRRTGSLSAQDAVSVVRAAMTNMQHEK